jgi:hypothetical protein
MLARAGRSQQDRLQLTALVPRTAPINKVYPTVAHDLYEILMAAGGQTVTMALAYPRAP